MSKNIAIIVAGGRGDRMKSHLPKQLLEVNGKTIIALTFEVFLLSKSIDEVIVMANVDFINETEKQIDKVRKSHKNLKPCRVLTGGKTRSETCRLALENINGDDIVLIHDAVRPFVDEEIILNCIEGLEKINAVCVAMPVTDTIVEVDSNNLISSTKDRKVLRRCQTPQAFKGRVIKKAYKLAGENPNFIATDDASLVSRFVPEEKIKVIMGSSRNIKITEPIDLLIAETLENS
jgi:2-C-methyl-D-erythritol 4-phosphate cytidylyltransferase